MEQVYLIKFLRNHKGKSLREIAKETGHDFQTVKKYVEKEDFNFYPRPKQQRKGKLDPYKPLIDQWLWEDPKAKPKQRHTAQRIFNRLKELYGDDFKVSGGLKAIFEHMGKVPVNLWFDNLSLAVKEIKRHGERDLTQGFKRFMLHYGFGSNFCNPNSIF